MPIMMFAVVDRRRPADNPVAVDGVWMLDQVQHDQSLFSPRHPNHPSFQSSLPSFQRRLESTGRRRFAGGEEPGAVSPAIDTRMDAGSGSSMTTKRERHSSGGWQLCCQAQALRSLSMALRWVRSFLATAMMATFLVS
ncbi:hypothetical protein, partial [Inquilinus sp. CAU 1745]|uniref:hypothetical protein n=1 Tax=Inquilinus sp. CAU 1745 TaxID=3140369 RepID=UPI00325AE5B1